MNSKILNRRKKTILFAILIFAVLLGVYLSGAFLSDELIQADFSQKGLAPSLKHPFGTDMLGRDMLVRTIKEPNCIVIAGSIIFLRPCLFKILHFDSPLAFANNT